MRPEELRNWRDASGYSQGELAAILGVALNSVSRWELGMRPIPPFLHLALKAIPKKGGRGRVVDMNENSDTSHFDRSLGIKQRYFPWRGRGDLGPFFVFSYHINSLDRYWQLSESFVDEHIEGLKTTLHDGKWETAILYSEIAELDIEWFPYYLRSSVISSVFAIYENMIEEVARQVADDIGVKRIKLDRNLPLIDEKIEWMKISAGIDVKIEKEARRKIESLRELRNKIAHRLNRDLQDITKKRLVRIAYKRKEDEEPGRSDYDILGVDKITKRTVSEAFRLITKFTKRLEKAYWIHYDNILPKKLKCQLDKRKEGQ